MILIFILYILKKTLFSKECVVFQERTPFSYINATFNNPIHSCWINFLSFCTLFFLLEHPVLSQCVANAASCVYSHYCDCSQNVLHLSSFLSLSLSQHFQSVLQTLEEQVAGERQRLVETHLARVVATLNNNRRLALESYLSAVQSDPPQVRPFN